MDLYLGDCLTIMPTLPEKSVDMVLCDLPYGVTANISDIPIDLETLWKQYSRVAKQNAAIVLFAQGVFYIDLVNSNRRDFRYDLMWDKVLTTGFLNSKRMPLRQHEQLAVFYKKLPTYNPQFTEGKPLHSKGKSFKTAPLKNQNYGAMHATDDTRAGSKEKYPTSILQFAKPHPSVAVHRTEKPVELLRWLIRTYTNEGDTVLDNCMGAGSTGMAAKAEGRNFIGIEIDPDYFNIAKERINSYKIDLNKPKKGSSL